MGSKVGKILKAVAPLALSAAFPGAGTAIGTALGATGAAAGALGSGLLGAGGGLLTGGGLKGALSGGALGALGGYVGSGGLSGPLKGTTLGNLLGGGSDSVTLPGIGATSLNNGSGIIGGLQKAGNSVSSSLSSNLGGGMSSYALPALGAASSLHSNQQAQEQLKKATNQANAALNPYTSAGAGATSKLSDFLGIGGNGASASDILASSPGYQFALDQGIQQLNRSQAARGGFNSGAAYKDLQNYTTGLANQTADSYYNKLAGVSGQGLGAAGQYGNNTTALGSAGANANIQTGNTLAQLLSGIGKRVVGYGTNGQPIYG